MSDCGGVEILELVPTAAAAAGGGLEVISEWVRIEDWSCSECRSGNGKRVNAGEPSALVTSSSTGASDSPKAEAAEPIALTDAGSVRTSILSRKMGECGPQAVHNEAVCVEFGCGRIADLPVRRRIELLHR